MSFTNDTLLTARLAAQLKQDVASLATYWPTTVTDCRNAAYNEIVTNLAARGYTPAQIAAWDRGAEFETDIGLFWCLTKGAGLSGEDNKFINMLDRRRELATISITNGAVIQDPQNVPESMIGVGIVSQTNQTFQYGVDGGGNITKTAW